MKPKADSLKIVNKSKWGKKIQISSVGNEGRIICRHSKMIKECYKLLCGHRFDNLDELICVCENGNHKNSFKKK